MLLAVLCSKWKALAFSKSALGLLKLLRKTQQDMPKLLRIHSSVGIKHIYRSLRQILVSRGVRTGSLSALESLTGHFDHSLSTHFIGNLSHFNLEDCCLRLCTLANSMLPFYPCFLIMSFYIFIILLFISSLLKWQTGSHIKSTVNYGDMPVSLVERLNFI